jgi:YjbE family integral membrane protein
MELFSPEFFSALLAIIVIDLVLAGDNAIVIALAARNVPKHLQKRAILWGTAGAIIVRTLMTLIVVWLLKIPGLMFAGGAMLIWIAYRLLVPSKKEDSEHVSSADSFWGAMKTIIVADALMGLDNVLAVAGAAHGSFVLVVMGLLISIPIVIWGSQLILKWVERFPVIVYIGAGVLALTAAKMMLGEPLLKDFLTSNSLVPPLTYLIVVGGVILGGIRQHHRRVQLHISEKLAGFASAAKSEDATSQKTGEAGYTMKRILLPVDGSKNSLDAVNHVVAGFLGNSHQELHLLHVRTPFSKHIARFLKRRDLATYHRDEATKALKAARERLDARGIPYAVHVEMGDKAKIIAAMARKLRAHQIVMGTSRKSSFTRMLEDSVTSKVLELTPVPVEFITGKSISPVERLGIPAGIGVVLATLFLAIE